MHDEQKLVKKYLEENHSDEEYKREVILGSYDDEFKNPIYNPAKYRADGIVFGDPRILILEGKLKAGPGAVSQLQFYKHLFRKTPRFEKYSDKRVRLKVVAGFIPKKVEDFYKVSGIRFVKVTLP